MEEKRKQTITVIGGSSGIGWELSARLAAAGKDVHVWSRNPHPEFEKYGISFSALDVTDAVDDILEPPAVCHGLVYCPGSIELVPFQRLKDQNFISDFNLNVIGAVRVLRRFLPSLQKARGASVVFFSTVAVRLGMSFHASIAASKAALEGLAKSLAAEWASRKIRVNVVSLSLTDTPQAESLLDSDDKKNKAAKRHPLGRYGLPADAAAAAAFLLSGQASWITGQIIPVDGGLSSIRRFEA
jgi:3-oxoacyl-[acyl-carrier protein] reductase